MKGLKTAAVFILICVVLSACGRGENPDKAVVTDALDRYVYMSDNEYIWFRGQGSSKCLVLYFDETGERKAALFDEEHKSLERFYEFCEE